MRRITYLHFCIYLAAGVTGILLSVWSVANQDAIFRVLPSWFFWSLAGISAALALTPNQELVPKKATIRRLVLALALLSLSAIYFLSGGIKYLIERKDPSTQKLVSHFLTHEIKSPILLARQRTGFNTGNLYEIRYSYPEAIYQDEDAKIEITTIIFSKRLMAQVSPILFPRVDPEIDRMSKNFLMQPEDLNIFIQLSSNSFEVTPPGNISIPLARQSPNIHYLVSAKETGRRRILIRSRLDPSTAKLLSESPVSDHSAASFTIEVLPTRYWLGLSMQQAKALHLVASAFGLPGAMVVLAGMLLAFLQKGQSKNSK